LGCGGGGGASSATSITGKGLGGWISVRKWLSPYQAPAWASSTKPRTGSHFFVFLFPMVVT
jgi:hypothetical protein